LGWDDGDRLRYRAPPGALTPELRTALAEWKPDLLCEYHERAGILQYDAHLPREEAEVRAADMLVASTTTSKAAEGKAALAEQSGDAGQP
jgi:hypothetical protein